MVKKKSMDEEQVCKCGNNCVGWGDHEPQHSDIHN